MIRRAAPSGSGEAPRSFVGRLAASALLAVLLGAGACARDAPRHRPAVHNLRTGAHEVITTHGLDVRLRMPARYRVAPPEHRSDRFNGHPFRISLTAFLAADSAVMVHAETVADDSGASNYDDLPTGTLAGLAFHRRPDQCVDLTRDQLKGEHDLLWLARNGFPPTGPLQVRQYLRSTAAHDREIVLTFMVRVPDCARREDNRQRLTGLIGQLRIDGRPALPAPTRASRP